MSRNSVLVRLGVAGIAIASLIAVVVFWPQGDSQASAKSEIWTCSMHPQIRLPNPGQCPI
ncbi:MAG: hypothetical protein FD138_3719, partial [Planctomycetota bacterium]